MMPDLATNSPPTSKIGGRLEDLAISLIVLGPMLGFLNPYEAWSNPATSFDVGASATAYFNDFPVTTQISHATFLVVALLFLKYWTLLFRSMGYASLHIALYSVFLLSATWSDEPSTTIRLCYHFFMFIILSTYLGIRYNNEELIDFFLRLFLISGVSTIITVFAVPQYALNQNLTAYTGVWRGVFTDKNQLGCVAALAVITSVYCLLRGRRPKTCLFILFVNLICLVQSHSATSMVGTFICSTVCAIVLFRKNALGRAAMLVAGTVSIVLVFAYVQMNADSAATGLIGRSATLTGRTDVWRVTLEAIRQRPYTGYGLGFWSFETRSKYNMWLELGWTSPHAHNDFLDITLQVGIFSTGLVILIYIVSFYKGVRLIISGHLDTLPYILWLLFFLIRSATETVSVSPANNLSMLIVLSVAQLFRSRSQSIREVRERNVDRLNGFYGNIQQMPRQA